MDSELKYSIWANSWSESAQHICGRPETDHDRNALLIDLGEDLVLQSKQDIGTAVTKLADQILQGFRADPEDIIDELGRRQPPIAVNNWSDCQILMAKRCIHFIGSSVCDAATSQEGVRNYVRRVCTDIVFLFIVSYLPKIDEPSEQQREKA